MKSVQLLDEKLTHVVSEQDKVNSAILSAVKSMKEQLNQNTGAIKGEMFPYFGKTSQITESWL